MDDQGVFDKWATNILDFIFDVWGLRPQPVLPEYRETVARLVADGKYDEIKADWFDSFIWGRHITWQQWLMCLALNRATNGEAQPRITIRSGHGIGKDAFLSWAILWYMFVHYLAQIPCTAPTSDQLHDILWKELKVWLDKMPEEIRLKYEWSRDYIRIVEAPETWFARARTASKERPEALAGVHGQFVMVVADEASGVFEEVFNTMEGALTGQNILVILISNPTRLVGYFYESFHKDAKFWQKLVFSSLDSPIVDPDTMINRIRSKHGEGSEEWKIRVTGEFPEVDTIDPQGYVPLIGELKWTSDSRLGSNWRKLGVDPAKEGRNRTVWVIRDAFKARVVGSEEVSNPKSIAAKTLTLMDEFDIPPDMVFVDSFGVGADVLQELALARWRDQVGIRVNGINVGDSASDEDYLNKRAEAYWSLRKWLASGAELVNHEGFKQLLSIRYRRMEQKSRIQIMPKQEMRRQGIDSPDYADALMLTFVDSDPEVVYDEENDDQVVDDDILFKEIGI